MLVVRSVELKLGLSRTSSQKNDTEGGTSSSLIVWTTAWKSHKYLNLAFIQHSLPLISSDQNKTRLWSQLACTALSKINLSLSDHSETSWSNLQTVHGTMVRCWVIKVSVGSWVQNSGTFNATLVVTSWRLRDLRCYRISRKSYQPSWHATDMWLTCDWHSLVQYLWTCFKQIFRRRRGSSLRETRKNEWMTSDWQVTDTIGLRAQTVAGCSATPMSKFQRSTTWDKRCLTREEIKAA
jgi:hypothetical protein